MSDPTGGEHAGPGTGVLDVPTRADGVQMLGDTNGSGYKVPPALARRGDGQTVQLTTLLYQVLDAVDGRRDLAEVAAAVSEASGRSVSADNVRQLLDDTLRPAGLVAMADGSQPDLRRANPLLALRGKIGVTDPDRTRALTAPFARLFLPVVVIPIVAAFGWIAWWTLVDKGLASATYQAFDHPGLLFLVLAVTVLSAGFHEFGHAAAARYGGATPGVMGAGFYLIWPAFYTDVTDSYRLGRAGRIRTDLGGLYFNAIVVVVTQAAWFVTRDDALLLLVATQVLQMLRQLMPVVRFDGYHVLADATGIPDLFHWIGPVLAGLLPWRWRTSKARALKPWARTVITAWVLAVVPMLAFALFTMVTTLPRIVGTAWAAAHAQASMSGHSWQSGDPIGGLARGLAALVVLLPIAALAVLLTRLGRALGRSLLRRTAGHPVRRSVAVLLVVALVAGLAWSWWPRPGTYAPVKPWERGSLRDAVALARPAPAFGVGAQGHTQVVWPADQPKPTRDHPALALVLVPRDGSGPTTVAADPGAGTTTGATTDPSTDPSTDTGATDGSTTSPPLDPTATWVFPVDQPLAPGPGDNQSVAVNTTDGTVVYDTAFAMVWDEGGQVADNANTSYALASCTGCAAISVAFQVVFVVGQTSAAVPQDVSLALNQDCVSCLTYSLAAQLFITLDGPLDDDQMRQLTALWSKIKDFEAHISSTPLSDIQTTLDGYQQQIVAIVHPAGTGTTPSDGPTPTDSPTSTDSFTPPVGSPQPLPTMVTTTEGGTPAEPTESPTDSPTTVPTSPSSTTTTPAPSPSPSPTASTSPTSSASPTTSTSSTTPSSSSTAP